MAVDILRLLSKFQPNNDVENEIAYFRTRVPWVAPEAYLNIIFKGAPDQALRDVAQKLNFPGVVTDLLRQYNGAMLFCGNPAVFGVFSPGQLLNRRDTYSQRPFNIESENRLRSRQMEPFLKVGAYSFDGSAVYINRTSGEIVLFKRGNTENPSYSWPNLEYWLVSEIERVGKLFSPDGNRIGEASDTVPVRVH